MNQAEYSKIILFLPPRVMTHSITLIPIPNKFGLSKNAVELGNFSFA